MGHRTASRKADHKKGKKAAGGAEPSLPPRPQGTADFLPWFERLTHTISAISSCEPGTADYRELIKCLSYLHSELLIEAKSTIDRKKSSVYDRSDYFVREVLRTGKLHGLVATGRAVARKLKPKWEDDFDRMIRLPSALSLMFTANETVGTVNLEDTVNFVADVMKFGIARGAARIEVEYDAEAERTIFQAAADMLAGCLDNLAVLNLSLFFTLCAELDVFWKIVKVAAFGDDDGFLERAMAFLNGYILASQAEADLARLKADPQFREEFRGLVARVVQPRLQEAPGDRAKFRSVLYFVRSLGAD